MKTTITASDGTVLDAGVVNLAKAIRTRESKGNYNAVGDAGTSKGAYQWQPGNFESAARQYGLDPNDFSPVNQDKVAYHQVKALKDKGYSPEQVAASWNAGEGSLKNDAWKGYVGDKIINGQKIHYDTPGYVNSVIQEFQKAKGNTGGQTSAYNPTPYSNPTDGASPFNLDLSGNAPTETQDTSLGGKLHERLQQGSTALSQAAGGQINPLSGILQTVGAGAGAIGDTIGAGLELIPGVKQGEELLGKGVTALAQTAPGQSVVKGVTDFSAKHPELSADIGAVGNIASVLPVFKGLGMAKDAVVGGVAKAIGKDAASAELEALTPKLKPKQYEKAAMAGKVQGPGFGKTAGLVSTAPEIQGAWSAIKKAATALGKNPGEVIKTSPGQITHNLNRTIDLTREYAQKVVSPFVKESGVDYNYSDLSRALSQVQPPKGLSGVGLSAWNRMKTNTLDAIANKIGPDVKNIRSLSEMRAKALGGEIPAKVLKGDEDFWDARKMIDGIYESETNGKIFGDAELNGAKAGYKDLRAAFKDYLSEGYRYPGQMDKLNQVNDFLRSPQGMKMNKTGWKVEDLEKQFGLQRNPLNEAKAGEWDSHMETLSRLYDAQRDLVTKVGSEKGMTGMDVFKKKHPVITGVLNMAGKGAAAGAGFKGVEGLIP